MDVQTKGVIGLIRSAITGEKCTIPSGFDWNKTIDIAQKHQITALVYYGVVNSGFNVDNSLMQYMLMSTYAQTALSEHQLHEIDIVCDAFENAKIDFMPLKGTILKKIYSAPEMRSMSDADILIRTEQYDEAAKIVSELGYTFKYESDHEYVWNKELFDLELHKRIMTTYNKDFYKYFGDGWRLAKRKSNNSTRHEMSDEDFFVYMFVHFTKHYRVSGIGIKHLVDLWVYKNAKKELDEKYIASELEKMKLYEFYINILDTLAAWFDGKDMTEKAEFITNVIFNSGVYGTLKAKAASDIIKLSKNQGVSVEGARLRGKIINVFLPYSDMTIKYPILKKIPLLLPVMWIVRLCKIVLFRRKAIKKIFMQDKLNTIDEVNEYYDSLKYVGLDFNFKE